MVSLIVHLVLGFATMAFIVKTNPSIFARYASGPQVTGYYFNNQYVAEYAPPGGLHNFIWGPGSWWEFITLGYANPAASSASQDYTIMSLLLFPLWSIVDGRRRGIKHAWLFCGFILFASSAFAWAAYLAVAERQHRPQQLGAPVQSPV
mgnify:CR=1 FL=1